MKVAVFTPSRHPGIAVSYESVRRQNIPISHWFLADQIERGDDWYDHMRTFMPGTNIDILHSEILPERNGNLEHVSNWALKRAREEKIDLLVILQDFIWLPEDAVEKFVKASVHHPFDLLTGRVEASKGPQKTSFDEIRAESSKYYSIFGDWTKNTEKPPGPYELDTRDQMGWWQPDPAMFRGVPDIGMGKYVSQHAWEINWGAMPYSIINAGIDFDEDYDYGTQWGNTDFAHQVAATIPGSQVWWDFYNVAYGMPHRDYFPATHEGERDLDNGWRFRQKWGNV